MSEDQKTNLSKVKGIVRLFESHIGEPAEDTKEARRRILEHVVGQQQQKADAGESPSPQMNG